MSTPAQVPMVDQNGHAGMVDADKVEGAKAAGYQPAVHMQGPDGALGYVAQDKVAGARAQKFSVTPDNPGVQRMATPQGQLTYALPNEVEQFKESGHVPIDDKGNFRVEPLEGEDNTDTMARAAKIANNLPPEVMKQAIAAEKKTFTGKRLAATLGTAAVAGPAILGLESGVGEAVDAAGAAAVPIARAAGTAAGTAVRLARTPIGKAVLEHTLKAAGAGAGYALAKKWLGL